ncbi:MAG: class B sortase [Alkalibacterium sp.]|nr:class B sortase [Alkalibacterium sp.]
MLKKIALIALAAAFFVQLFIVLRTNYIYSNPAEVPSLSTEEIAEARIFDYPGTDRGYNSETSKSSTLPDTETLLYQFQPNSYSDYLAINQDFTGWLAISNTAIDYPVVKGRDNEFYLEHDFYKDQHPFGSIFMDYRNVGMGHDDHTILYGHYTSNGNMFADLEKFLSEDFFNSNQKVVFQDLFTERTFEIFSVHIAPADAYFINESFRTDDLADYYETLKDLSVYERETEFSGDEKLMTLISCNYTVDDGRVYVHAIEVTD